MKAGDTYRATGSIPGVDARRHLWILLSDPLKYPDKILTVFMTSRKAGHDRTCTLEPGDHPFVEHETTIAYSEAKVWTLEQLRVAVANDRIKFQEPISQEVLQRIRSLLPYSPKTPFFAQQIASDQGLDS